MNGAVRDALGRLGALESLRAVSIGNESIEGADGPLAVRSPIDGSMLAELAMAGTHQVDAAILRAAAAFEVWRTVPAPQRGHVVREFGEHVRRHKADLATLVSHEAGKITQEALGEVQEMIDICEFAVGLSRQLYGRTIASERPRRRPAFVAPGPGRQSRRAASSPRASRPRRLRTPTRRPRSMPTPRRGS